MANKSSPHDGYFIAGTISRGTLREQDLLEAFADEYERLLPFNSAKLCYEARTLLPILNGAPTPQEYQEAGCILEDLMDALNEIARREGPYYFGAHEGDGSDFGFWRIEDEE